MIGERIRRARLAKGLSLEKLAVGAGDITKQAINKYELGRSMPSSDVMLRLAKALDVKVEYFFRPVEVKLEKINFRRKASLSATERKKIEEIAKESLERYLMLEEVFPADQINAAPFEEFDFRITNSEDAEVAAVELREAWALGLAPIENMTELLEEHGIKVVEVECTDKFDGLSGFFDAKYAVVVIGRQWPGDRQRFTLAHELGHLVLKISSECVAKEHERCCQRFAAAFLAPAQTVFAELGRHRREVSFAEWLMLKKKYGLSMAAWVLRARDLEIISHSLFLQIWKEIGRQKWRKVEPLKIEPEKPARFKRLLLHALSENLISETKAADLLGIRAGQLWHEIEQWTSLQTPA